jgi:uncharacterized linocin/CFP29 family protein
MNDLLKSLAPISSAAWEEIEDEAKETLKATLAARRVVDFDGPIGWDKGVVETGRVKSIGGPRSGVDARMRVARSLVELRTDFTLAREELDSIDRGAKDADLDPVREAAHRLALAEDNAVFHGFSGGDIEGIGQAASGATLTIPTKYEEYPHVVAEALRKLNEQGVAGPYAIVLGPRCYEGLTKTATGGFPVINHVQRLVDGPIVRAQAVDGAFVLSLRGGDFCLTVGRDISIGYASHDAKSVSLYMVESFTFQTLGEEAAVPLTYSRAKKK